MLEYRSIQEQDLAGVVALRAAEPWPSYTQDPQRTWRALTAPGVTTIVAAEDGRVVGFAQVLSDGQIAAFLSLLLVAADRRQDRDRHAADPARHSSGAGRRDWTC